MNSMCKFVNNTKHSRIDKCMKPLVRWFNRNGYHTCACCCGHNRYPITIITKWRINKEARYLEILSGIEIRRKRNFYVRDKQGYYHIPEVSNKSKLKEKNINEDQAGARDISTRTRWL